MLRILLLVLLLTPAFAAELTWDALPEDARELVNEVLAANKIIEPELDADKARVDFVALVDQVKQELGDSKEADQAIAILNKHILQQRQVSYLSNKYWRDCSFVAALQRKKGNCFATTTLYTTVARALELPVYACLVPEHIFASWVEGEEIYHIETTNQGRIYSTAYYASQFELNEEDMYYYNWLQPIADQVLLAELHSVVASHLAGQLKYKQALVHLEKVLVAREQRPDLRLTKLDWQSKIDGNRKPLLDTARAIAGRKDMLRPAVLAALYVLKNEYAARLDRANERDILLRMYALSPEQERGSVLFSLSTCLRGLRDHTAAVLCMELAVAADPEDLYKRAWLAGLLVEADRADEGLKQIELVRKKNPELSYFALIHAGTLVGAGKREAGMTLFKSIEAPRTGLQNWETNRAWFYSVWADPELFYPQFERALSMAKDPGILSWIAEDDDLDKFRQDERFQKLVKQARDRILNDDQQ